MNSVTDNQPGVVLGPATNSPEGEILPVPIFAGSAFLMVNTLETGGTERQFVEMTRALRADRVPVHLGCIRNRGPFGEGLGEIAEFRLGGSLYGLQSMRTRWRLGRHLRKLGVAVAHAFDFYTNLTLIPAARMAGVPVVGSHRQLGDLLTSKQFRAQMAAFRMCDRVVCNSQAAADRLVEAGLPQRKIAVIGNALPPEAFLTAKPALDRVTGTLRIGMIARMNAESKNHRGFLRAAEQLAGKFPHLEFVLAGDGPLRADLEREAAERGLAGRVLFLGDRRDIPAVLASLDVSVIPSASESLSNVMLESMAAGVAVIATATGGNTEIGGDGRANLVPVNDDRALAEALAGLVENATVRSTMARAAREFVKDKFSVDRVCGQYEELYAEVAERRSRHGARVRPGSDLPLEAPIRVAFVAPSLRYVGGQSVQADLLLKNWRNDAEVAASFVAVDPRFPFGLGWAERVPFLRTVLREPIYAWRLWRDLRDVDVAHIFSASYTSFLLAPLPACFMARLRGKKTLLNYHSGEARDHLQKSGIARRTLKRVDRLVVPSGYLVDVFKEFGLEATAASNIVDLSQFRYRARRPLRPHLVCTRGFHPYYGVDVVVRAFAEVLKAYPEAQLDLVGGGQLERSIRDLVQQLKLPNVNFVGVVSRQDIGRHYDRADVFVNGSNLDNMPVTVLEAFASGTPVVTTSPECMPYLVSHERTGLLSPVGEPGALAANILRVLREPELAERLAQNAFEESKRYRWETVREQWLRVYDGLVPRVGKAGVLDRRAD